jgi:hypothetical protein
MTHSNRKVGATSAAGAAIAAALMMVSAGARAEDEPDLTLRKDVTGEATITPPAAVVTTPPDDGFAGEVPSGFYRDRQGRIMQVSFDFGRRLWLGVGYAPHRTPAGQTEISPAAFDFGITTDELSEDGRTRRRYTVLDGQVRLHDFGLDVTGFRYDLSHRYNHPLVRITTFVKEAARHDLYLNVGLYSEMLHFETEPRGIQGEESLTIANLQATLDLWQSEDLRSYVRLRAGPGIETRFGPWAQETRYVGILPQATLEGNVVMGQRAMQRLNFRLRGELLRSATWHAEQLPGNWIAAVDAAYEAIIIAINDQPVSLRFAASAFLRDDARQIVAGVPTAQVWGWTGTAGIRMAFFSPPVPQPFRAQAFQK